MNHQRKEQIKKITKEAEIKALIVKADIEADQNITSESYAKKFTDALIDSIVIEGLDN